MLRSLLSISHSCGALRNRQLCRSLATGVVYIRHLPSTTSLADLEDTAKQHGSVYGVWRSSDSDGASDKKRPAAIRMVTEQVPRDIAEIARLPTPTAEEVERITDAVNSVVSEFRRMYRIDAVAVLRDHGMFQSASRRIADNRHGTDDFDVLTTNRPRYTRGMIDGYRRGFVEAAKQSEQAQGLAECTEKGSDQLASLIEYFEHRHYHGS
ncbi:hypothetical protein EC988_006334 [Linderina pennispora]|nr:hypothetical protein EC988_006334 [Linderina pennispora]